MPIKLSHDKPPHDEIGLPEHALTTCKGCRRPYPRDGWHACPKDPRHNAGDVPRDIRETQQ